MSANEAQLKYIDNQDSFLEFIEECASSDVLGIDTEFIRERSYYPNLCLIQVANRKEAYIIDPFCIDDLAPLKGIFENKSIVKIFHAGSQDLEIIKHDIDAIPDPIFDVQIAASVLGMSYQAGLSSVLSHFLNVNIKKGDSFTDWEQRPLTHSQIEYAAEDVIYLPALYDEMIGLLVEKGRLGWLDSEFESLIEASCFEADPYERFRHLKRGNQLNRHQSAIAKNLAAWREIEVRKRDIPRKWLLSDEQLVEICKRSPKNIDELFMVRGIKSHLSMKDARSIVSLVKESLRLPDSEWPQPLSNNSAEKNVDIAVDLMTTYARMRSKEEGIAFQMLVPHSSLSALARGYDEDSGLMSGWRREIIGNDLKQLLNGGLFLGIKDNELVVR